MDGKEKTLSIISRTDAEAAGLVRFYTGKACRHGHTVERYVKSGLCVECNRARSRVTVKAHYGRHKARILDSKRTYYANKKQQQQAATQATE